MQNSFAKSVWDARLLAWYFLQWARWSLYHCVLVTPEGHHLDWKYLDSNLLCIVDWDWFPLTIGFWSLQSVPPWSQSQGRYITCRLHLLLPILVNLTLREELRNWFSLCWPNKLNNRRIFTLVRPHHRHDVMQPRSPSCTESDFQIRIDICSLPPSKFQTLYGLGFSLRHCWFGLGVVGLAQPNVETFAIPLYSPLLPPTPTTTTRNPEGTAAPQQLQLRPGRN